MSEDEFSRVIRAGEVIIKPSYWMIFQLVDHVRYPPCAVCETVDTPAPCGVDHPQSPRLIPTLPLNVLDINIARLFRMDEVSDFESTVEAPSNFQCPGLRMHTSVVETFRQRLRTAIREDFAANPEMWTIQGHPMQGLVDGSVNFLDNPSGQRLARATKVHDCVYHEIVIDSSSDRQVIRATSDPCPYAAKSHVCISSGRRNRVPCPPVRFHTPTHTMYPADKPVLASKSMRVEFVCDGHGADISDALGALAHPEWGCVLEQAWTCPYVTLRTNATSASIVGVGAHIDQTMLSHNGNPIPRASDLVPGSSGFKKRLTQISRQLKLVLGKTVERSNPLFDLVAKLLGSHFTVLDTSTAWSPYHPKDDQLFTLGYPFVPLRIGKSTSVHLARTSKSASSTHEAVVVLPVDDISSMCQSLYCEHHLRAEEQVKTYTAAFHVNPLNKGLMVRRRIGSNPERGFAGVPANVLHQVSHHCEDAPIFYELRADTITKHCTVCKKQTTVPITDMILQEQLRNALGHATLKRKPSQQPDAARKVKPRVIPTTTFG